MSVASRRSILGWGGVVLAGAGVYLTMLAYLKPGNVFAFMLLASFCG